MSTLPKEKEVNEQNDKKLLNYFDQARNGKMVLTDFLPVEQQDFLRFHKPSDLYIEMDGGYSDAEYKRCFITNSPIPPEFNLVLFKVLFNKRFLTLTHRHVLGNLMALGIKREVVGDIVISESVYFIAKKELKDYFLNELKTMNGKPISLEVVNDIDIKEIEHWEKKTIFVNSIRIDSIISLAYGLSRNESKELILSENVKLNHRLILDPIHPLKIADVLSVRGKGRLKMEKLNGESKSGRIICEIGLLK